MSDSESQLKIRIRLNEPAPEKPPEETVEYRWDRIIGALVIATLIIGSAITGLIHWTASPEEPHQPLAIEPVTLGSRNNSQQDNPTPALETPQPIVVPIQSGTTEETTTQPADRDLSIPVANATPALVNNRAPEQVVRATLTTGLRDGEPVDRAPALITMNAQGLLRLYFVTELQGLKGQTLHHDWYRNGQRQARITMTPQLDRLSAHSSKYVDTHQLGDWQVKVVSNEGEVLVEAGFEVR